MASPQPESAAAVVKPAAEPALEKPETNGHASTPPLTNGKTESSPSADNVTGHETQNTDAVASNRSLSAKPDEPDTADTTQAETSQTQDTSLSAPDDVDMGDSSKPAEPETETVTKKANTPEPSAEPVAEPVKAPSAPKSPEGPVPEEPKKDVEMKDAPESPEAKPTTEEPKSESKATPPPQDDDAQPTSLSQLAIDGKDEHDNDVAMDDAPPVKVAREREEDSADEPAAKRAKTEPSEDEASQAPAPELNAAPVSEATTKSSKEVIDNAFRGLLQWNDAEVNARAITNHRIREYRRVLAGSKKTKAGGGFRDAVAKLWPVLADNYIARVEKPMDIGLMERNLRDSTIYKTLGDLKDDLVLLYYNTYLYNGAIHDVTLAGKAAVEQIWHKLIEVPADEPPKSRAPAKHNPTRHTEPRAAPPAPAPPPPPPKKESRPAPTSPSTAEAYAVPPGGVPQVRRASTQNENDRPKRTIHPPKNRDIDYTAMQNFNKKKLPLDLQFAYETITELMEPRNEVVNSPFLAPVDPVALQIPQYWSIIKKPMDLGTMKSKLVSGEYQTLQQVQQDIKLIIANCNKFNGPDHPITYQANQLGELAKTFWAKKDQWLAKNTPKTVDADSSEESEGESDEEEAAAGAKGGPSAAVTQLEKRLADEAAKLSEMLVNLEGSDETMIDVQRTVIGAIRKRLIEEKEKAPATAKADKPAKSKSTTKGGGRTKAGGAGGGGGGKKAGSAPRKSGGAPKKKRSMSQAEKDAIANGINDLDESNITKAIDIIKKDTGQHENDSGELELEIDQLSNEALHKLWDLLKRVLPNFASSIPARDASPVSNGPTKGSKGGSKPKKNKPMNAREQEARIAELERLKQSYQAPGQEPGADREPEMPVHPLHDDSSDSEEE